MNPAETAVGSAGEPARSRPVLRGDVSDRDRHYGVFYGVAPLPGDAGGSGDADAGDAVPRVVVVGNCQAESLRIVLESSGDIQSFRVPPIHEWETRDMPFVEFAMQWANVLVTQPVRNDYRGLPCGTEQLASLMRTDGSPTHVLRYPVLRFSALNPRWAIVRSPLDSSLSPPVVPYHDLHLIAQLAGLQQVNEPDYQGIVEANVQLMAAREGAHGTVGMSTYLRELPEWHTLNHPNNATLTELGTRVMQAIRECEPEWAKLNGQVSAPTDREMLGHLRSPVDPRALEALSLPASDRSEWTLHGEIIPAEEIEVAHRSFYREHPEFIEAALKRHADLFRLLGFSSSAEAGAQNP